MLEIGKYQVLTMVRFTEPGAYLQNEEGEEILLPNKYVPKDAEEGDDIHVFVYLDSMERPVATTLKPKITVDAFASLEVMDVTKFGAFLDMGLEKHLLLPYNEQTRDVVVGENVVVFCRLDHVTDRLMATAKIYKYLDNDELEVATGDEVDLMVYEHSDYGFNVMVNEIHKGLIYTDSIFQELKIGDKLKGYIKTVRPENKLDISLQKIGYRNTTDPNTEIVMNKLEANNGFLPFHDKSDPDDIRSEFKMSKKNFKKAIGHLYKEKLIRIEAGDGIYRV